jgi:DMSO/TMAO reductase YedYZ molybdopterin-dependent catalytic subunit
MAVVIGRLLGAAFLICFGTGLYSHFLQDPLPWMHFATRPTGLYQVTQGLHIITGIACFPLLFGKLYTVFPQLFQVPLIGSFPRLLERASIALFVASSLVQITIGILNTYQYYPFPFPFRQVHYALSFVIIGSLAIHIAVKLPIIRRYWFSKDSYDSDGNVVVDESLDAPAAVPNSDKVAGGWGLPPGVGRTGEEFAVAETAYERKHLRDGVTGRVLDWIDSAPKPAKKMSRRTVLATVGLSTVSVVALTAGQTTPILDFANVFAPRKKNIGPAGIPINRTAKAAGVLDLAVDPNWVLTVANGDTEVTFTLDQLAALTQHEVQLPIACVEGWSQLASWKGVRFRDLADAVGAPSSSKFKVTSLEVKGGYRMTTIGAEFVQDDLTLIATKANGQVLDIQHGYPARLIAPARPGVLQTKWLSRLEVI